MKEEDMMATRCCGPSPFNTGTQGPLSVNEPIPTAYCSGRVCAAWRWMKPFQKTYSAGDQGFCGLAGSPP